MVIFRWGFATLLLTVGLASAGFSAPLFGDVPSDHWAQDAVATLSAKGLIEGYPDGTFKGDRSASRWETAMIVARLLAKMDQAHESFASTEDLRALRKLAEALREELDALGVRVDHLQENVGQIDKRVTELERISFYGSVDTRVNFHSFQNQGNHFSDPTDAIFNYDAIVGTGLGAGAGIRTGPAAGQSFNPFAFGAFNVTNLDKGTPLVNGTGFTSLATLGLNIVVTEDVDARAEFKAFTSQGNVLTGLYYGVSAPYLSNKFTSVSSVSGGLAGIGPANHGPFTRMNLDHFWVHHKPSNIRIRLGAISDLKFDELVYQNPYNPSAFAPSFLDSYGLQVTGQQDLKKGQDLSWELLGTLLPDRNPGVDGSAYSNQAWGGNIAYNFSKNQGQVKLNFLRASNDASGGAARQVGLISAANNTPTPWVNPNGFFFNQLGGPNQATEGIGSLGDVRPIPMPVTGNDGNTGIDGLANYGNIGPQAQDMYGISSRYNWGGEFLPYLKGEYAHTEYRPNQNSRYTVGGDAFRLSAGASFFEETLTADLEYLAVDPTYDPFVLLIPPAHGFLFNGYRFGEDFFHTRGDRFTLHDSSIFPQNREGFRAKLKWDFADEGTVGVRIGLLDQRKASLQDVRFSAGSLGPGTPNTPVLGFSPGFTDPVFGGFSPFTFTSSNGNALAAVLETPIGTRNSIAVDARYRWTVAESDPEDDDYWSKGLTLTTGFNTSRYERNSHLATLLPGPNGISGENVNNVDLSYTSWGINLDYDLSPRFTLNGGYSEFTLKGHYDPYGIYSRFAVANNTTTFDNLNLTQSQPTVGFEYAISDSVNWDLATIFLSTKDKVSSAVFSTPVIPGQSDVFTAQRSIHPFSFDGIMVNSRFNFSF